MPSLQPFQQDELTFLRNAQIVKVWFRLVPIILHLITFHPNPKIVNLAGVMVLVYDYFLTLGDEVKLVWPSKWSALKVLYFMSRYLAFVDASTMLVFLFRPNLSPNLCQATFRTASYFASAGYIMAQIILSIRTYAIWGRSRRILSILSALLLITHIPGIILQHEALDSLHFQPSPQPNLISCEPSAYTENSLYIVFALMMMQDLAIVLLTMARGYTQWKECRSPIVITLYRDGFIYFICLFGISFANFLIFELDLKIAYNLLFELQRVIHSVLSSRLILNLRSVSQNREDGPMTTIAFAHDSGSIAQRDPVWDQRSLQPNPCGSGHRDMAKINVRSSKFNSTLMGTPLTNGTELGGALQAPRITVQGLRDVTIVKNFIVASVVILIYDTVLTLPSEIRFIWRSKWRIGKILYFITRYPAFIDVTLALIYWFHRDVTSETTCRHLFRANAWLFLLGTYIAEAILSLRTYALWERSTRVLVVLAVLAHASFITQIIELQHFLRTVEFADTPAPSIMPCNAILHRTKLYVNFALVVIFELAVLIMTFWKGYKQWRQCQSPIMSTLYRDSIIIFVCLFAVSTTNLLLFLMANINVFYDILALTQRVIHAILSARVVLHLRIAASSEKTAKFTTIAFIEPSEGDPLEDIHHLDHRLDDDMELASTSSRSSSISSNSISASFK
ncbi:hypothetical protein SCHPADRAFT_945358 [Schizopora paradoxa]|uniref:DUF6533 domain-containing protein n=1 Tax=Schizopora paradoxa TaxID=27342 RepID=A0A0H2R7K9_9AGAM|nr:hypothetical protein SCHPADRAFT_945358 [Schizopora paradoxa]